MTSELMNDLENASAAFRDAVGAIHQPTPSCVWHYTGPTGLLGILGAGKLWAPSSRTVEDQEEIRWGDDILKRRALVVGEDLGGHPGLRALVREDRMNLFMKHDEMFIACFTTDENSERQWQRPGVRQGGAIVFDGRRLSGLLRRTRGGGTGLVRVQYDETLLAELADLYFRSILRTVAGSGFGSEKDPVFWDEVSQYLMEPGGLSFYWKREHWRWEQEWRLIQWGTGSAKEVVHEPKRRIEAEMPLGVVVRVVLGDKATPATADAVRAFCETRWQAPVEQL